MSSDDRQGREPLSGDISSAADKHVPRWRRELVHGHRPTLILVISILLVFAWQFAPMLSGGQGRGWDLGVSRYGVLSGQWWTLVTTMWIHANLLHIVMNLMALWALGQAVGIRCGPGVAGAVRYYALYLISGIAGSLAYVVLQSNPMAPAVGASGAIFGLAGAIGRLQAVEAGETRLFSRHMLRFTWALIKSNMVLVVLFAALAWMGGGGGLAWEAHLGGFIAGFLLAPLFARPLRPWIDKEDDPQTQIPAVFRRD